jgi:hypothetical protein
MNNLIAAAILLLALLAGCTTSTPSNDQLTSADYGAAISQEIAEVKAKDFFERYLKDPGSATYKWRTVARGWLRRPIIDGGALSFGYIMDVQVNAKNSFGGYVGFKPYKIVFFNGAVSEVYGEKSVSGGTYMGKIL